MHSDFEFSEWASAHLNKCPTKGKFKVFSDKKAFHDLMGQLIKYGYSNIITFENIRFECDLEIPEIRKASQHQRPSYIFQLNFKKCVFLKEVCLAQIPVNSGKYPDSMAARNKTIQEQIGFLSFQDCKFKGFSNQFCLAEVYHGKFERCTFENMTIFNNIKWIDLVIEGCKFKSYTMFLNNSVKPLTDQYDNYRIGAHIDIRNTSFINYVGLEFILDDCSADFTNIFFKKIKGEAKNDFRRMKLELIKIGEAYEAERFHSWELKGESRQSLLNGRFGDLILLRTYNQISFFGFNYLDPLLWIFALLPLSFFLSTQMGGIAIEKPPIWLDTKINGVTDIIFALKIFLGPLYSLVLDLSFHPHSWLLKLYQGCATILSTILWFLLLIGLRKRFKLSV